MAFVPEGYLAYGDAIAFVAERRGAAVVGGQRRAYAMPLDEAVSYLRANLMMGDIRTQFVCDTIGVFDIPALWFAEAELAPDGRPRDGFHHGGHVFQGHVVVEAIALARAIDNSERRSVISRERRMGVLHDPRAARGVAAAPPALKSGRPRKYDYTWLAIEVANIFYNEAKPPTTHAALIDMLLERYQERFGTAPDASTLRPLVREAFRRLGLEEEMS